MDNYELLVDAGRDGDKGLWFSYLCPQAYEYVETKYRTLKVPSVKMCQFPLSSLAPQLLPDGCTLPEDEHTTNLSAVYFGLERFLNRMGPMPVGVVTAAPWVVNCLNGSLHDMLPVGTAWSKAIFNIKWLGVTVRWSGQIRVRLSH